jgi:hypothetical protein
MMNRLGVMEPVGVEANKSGQPCALSTRNAHICGVLLQLNNPFRLRWYLTQHLYRALGYIWLYALTYRTPVSRS